MKTAGGQQHQNCLKQWLYAICQTLYMCMPLTQGNTMVSIRSDGVQAASLSLPCRDMCKAVTSTCGCGQERSVGDLLEKAMQGLLVSIFTTCFCFQRSTESSVLDNWVHNQQWAVVMFVLCTSGVSLCCLGRE